MGFHNTFLSYNWSVFESTVRFCTLNETLGVLAMRTYALYDRKPSAKWFLVSIFTVRPKYSFRNIRLINSA